MSSDPVIAYIHENWDRSIYRDRDGSGFRGIDLPYPYTSPCIRFADFGRVRELVGTTGMTANEKARIGGQFLAEAETGWDFNQRFAARCLDHNAVDLNGLLYDYETWLGDLSSRFDWGDGDLSQERADRRRELADRYLWSSRDGWFFDYDWVNRRAGPVYALAGMLPLFTGLASPEQAAAAVRNLDRFERDHGVAVTEERPECRRYQWAYPNAWPPLTWVAVASLRRYGFEEDARRIAGKYVETTRSLFARTGQLWEKTDVETGDVAGGEYDAAPMIGWTAGVYIALREFLEG